MAQMMSRMLLPFDVSMGADGSLGAASGASRKLRINLKGSYITFFPFASDP